MPLLLVVLLVVVPLVEVYLLVQVGQAVGALPTIALLVLMSVVGAALLKREGTRTWRAFREATASGRVPAREVADGALVLFGGALLLTPGFATDVVGLLCVLPVSRAVLRRALTGLVASRLGVVGMVGGLAADQVRRRRTAARPGGGRVVDGQVVDGQVVDGQAAGPVPGSSRPPASGEDGGPGAAGERR